MQNRRLAVTTSVLTGSVLAGGMAAAQTERHSKHSDDLVERVAHALTLSNPQKADIRATLRSHGNEFELLQQRLQDQQQGLLETLEGESDEASVQDIAAAIGDTVEQMVLEAGALKREVDESLTHEQRDGLNEMIAMRAKHGRSGLMPGQTGRA